MCYYFLIIMDFYNVEIEEYNRAVVNLGLRIRKIREETTNFSQDTLALEVDLSENQIRRIEKGQTNPTIKSLLKIAKALKVDIKDLF